MGKLLHVFGLTVPQWSLPHAVFFEGEGDKTVTFTPEQQAHIDGLIAKSVEGLKGTNTALKDEKKAIKLQLDGFTAQFEQLGGEEGIKSLKNLHERLSKDEDLKLLGEGKHEEWLERKTAALRTSQEKALKVALDKATEADTRAEVTKKKLHTKVLETAILQAASTGGVRPEAVPDVQLRAERTFVYDDETDSLVIKDKDGEVQIGKDGKSPMGVPEWLEAQKETARHWWPESKGGGAGGSGERGGSGAEDLSKVPFPEFERKRRAQQEANGGKKTSAASKYLNQ